MTDLALAPADAPAPAAGATSAAALASRIEIPRRLPPRSDDGEPIRHLSHSSYALWVTCKEAWRLRYLQQRREPTSGAMFLGSRVDDALTLYHRRILEHGERLDLAQVTDAYRDLWRTETRGRGAGARRGLERHPSARRVRARRAGARADLRAARPQARGAGRGATPARVHARTGSHGVDGRLLPRPRNPQPALDRRAARPRRRLQGQGQPDRPADGRPRPAGKPLPRRPLARGPARRGVRVRADREARTAAKTDERSAHHHPANARAAARSPGTDRARRGGNRRLLPALRR